MTTKIEEDLDAGWEPWKADSDSSNVVFRAGYLRGLAAKLPEGDDRVFVRRAARSLLAYARLLQEKK